MSTLLILFLLIGVGIFGTLEWYKIKLDVSPRKTPMQVIDELVNMLGVPETEEDPGGSILHLGSGFGDMVLDMAKKLPAWQIDGVEQNPALWLLSNLRTIGKQSNNFRFYLDNYTTYPLRNHEMIFINQDQKVVSRWEASIGRRLPVGVLVVTLNSKLPHVKAINTIEVAPNLVLNIYERRAKEETVTQDVMPQSYAVDQADPEFTPADIPPSAQPQLPLETQPQMVPNAPEAT